MAKPQLNIYVDEDLLEQIDQAVERFGKKSRAAAAGEIIETYLKFWIRSEEAKLQVIESQKEFLEKGQASVMSTQKQKKRS
jgi:metal-responsive CopG/Arc/MetJ family transcriptional regulator